MGFRCVHVVALLGMGWLTALGCHSGASYAGGGGGGVGETPDGAARICVATQLDSSARAEGAKDVPLLFVVFWLQPKDGSGVRVEASKVLESINGYAVSVPQNRRGVYALQRDYTVRRIDLSAGEIDLVIGLKSCNRALWKDRLFLEKVLPELQMIPGMDPNTPIVP